MFRGGRNDIILLAFVYSDIEFRRFKREDLIMKNQNGYDTQALNSNATSKQVSALKKKFKATSIEELSEVIDELFRQHIDKKNFTFNAPLELDEKGKATSKVLDHQLKEFDKLLERKRVQIHQLASNFVQNETLKMYQDWYADAVANNLVNSNIVNQPVTNNSEATSVNYLSDSNSNFSPIESEVDDFQKESQHEFQNQNFNEGAA